MHLRDLVNVVEYRLLESGGERAEGFDGVLDSLPHCLVLQGLVVGHIIWQLPGGKVNVRCKVLTGHLTRDIALMGGCWKDILPVTLHLPDHNNQSFAIKNYFPELCHTSVL